MVKACLSQTASRTAQQFVVAVARKDKWKERVNANLDFQVNLLNKRNAILNAKNGH